MSSCISHKSNVKSRKEHKCFGCYVVMPKGTVTDVAVCVEDGKIYSVRLCKECEEISSKVLDDWYQGDLGEYRREEQIKKEQRLEYEAECYIESKGW